MIFFTIHEAWFRQICFSTEEGEKGVRMVVNQILGLWALMFGLSAVVGAVLLIISVRFISK